MAYIDDPHGQRANARYIRSSMRAPMLAREAEFALARRWRTSGDLAALHSLVGAYARLVVSLATRFRNYGLPISDLVQEGNIGLMLAAARFEPEREVRFSTYASWWIRSAIQDYVLRNWSIVRTGTTTTQKSLFFNLRRLRARIEDRPEGGMTSEGRARVARTLGVDVKDVEAMEGRMQSGDQSLDVPVGENGEDTRVTFLADDRPGPEAVVIGTRDAETRTRWLAQALSTLTPRERHIVSERRLREDGATLEDLGRALGVSKERVRQIETRALDKLRTHLCARVEFTADLYADAN